MKKMILLMMFLAVASFASAEEVRLKSGVIKRGEVFEKTDQDITLKDGVNKVTIPFSMISEDQVDALRTLPNKTAMVEQTVEPVGDAGKEPPKIQEDIVVRQEQSIPDKNLPVESGDPEKFKEYFLEAMRASKVQDDAGSDTLLKKALQERPESPEVYAEFCHQGSLMHRSAETDIDNCLKAIKFKLNASQDPEIQQASFMVDFIIKHTLADAYLRLKQYDKSFSYADDVIFTECPASKNPDVNEICPKVRLVVDSIQLEMYLAMLKSPQFKEHYNEILAKSEAYVKQAEQIVEGGGDQHSLELVDAMRKDLRKAKNPLWPF